MSLDIDGYLGIHAKALAVRDKRSAVIANNIANVDTPNFKAQDIDFKQVLKQFDNKLPMLETSHSQHMKPQDNLLMAMKFRVPQQGSLDGNTVNKDVETTEFARNAMQYQASLNFLNSKIKTVMTALRGE